MSWVWRWRWRGRGKGFIYVSWIMEKYTSFSWRWWRLTKVLYFLVTIPLIWSLVLVYVLYWSEHYCWVDSYWINNYVWDPYIWLLIFIACIALYIILTDWLRRILYYVLNWSFDGFLNYKLIFTYIKKYFIVGWILIWILLFLSFFHLRGC